MLFLLPTKRGMGVELWGTYDDLEKFYSIVSYFSYDETFINKENFENRSFLISSFSYEIRKAKDGNRLNRKNSHYSFEPIQYFGCIFSWVHILFSLQALRYNMRYIESNKYHLGLFLQLEYELENAMKLYDEVGANKLIPYITENIYVPNDCLYQYMRSINLDFFQLGGGKTNFRKLPVLLKKAIFTTNEYKDYYQFLIDEGKRLNCHPNSLELSDDDFNYDNIKL